MAQAGGGAAAGGGGGRADVPDLSFLMEPGHQNPAALQCKLTLEEREQVLVEFLEMHKVDQKELNLSYRISDAVNMEPAPAVALFRRGSGLVVSIFRKRRHAYFLMIMLRSFGGCKNSDVDVPRRYRDAAQVEGDIASLKKQIQTLYAQALEVSEQVKTMSRIPLAIPEVFEKPVQLPK